MVWQVAYRPIGSPGGGDVACSAMLSGGCMGLGCWAAETEDHHALAARLDLLRIADALHGMRSEMLHLPPP